MCWHWYIQNTMYKDEIQRGIHFLLHIINIHWCNYMSVCIPALTTMNDWPWKRGFWMGGWWWEALPFCQLKSGANMFHFSFPSSASSLSPLSLFHCLDVLQTGWKGPSCVELLLVSVGSADSCCSWTKAGWESRGRSRLTGSRRDFPPQSLLCTPIVSDHWRSPSPTWHEK